MYHVEQYFMLISQQWRQYRPTVNWLLFSYVNIIFIFTKWAWSLQYMEPFYLFRWQIWQASWLTQRH